MAASTPRPGAAIGAAVFVLWLAVEPRGAANGAGVEAVLAGLSRGAAWLWLGFQVIGSTPTVPPAEERASCGYLIRKLMSPTAETVRPGRFTWLSSVVPSVAFGLPHRRWFAGTPAGMAYAGALDRRGQSTTAVYAHLTTQHPKPVHCAPHAQAFPLAHQSAHVPRMPHMLVNHFLEDVIDEYAKAEERR